MGGGPGEGSRLRFCKAREAAATLPTAWLISWFEVESVPEGDLALVVLEADDKTLLPKFAVATGFAAIARPTAPAAAARASPGVAPASEAPEKRVGRDSKYLCDHIEEHSK
jgi:hypothetical protein